MALRLRFFIVAILGICYPVSPVAAQSVNSGFTTNTVLSLVSSAFSSGKSVRSVQLIGTVERYAGDLQESGSITLTGSSDGSMQTSMQLNDGLTEESVSWAGVTRNCTWTDASGLVHDGTAMNCFAPLIWFLPTITVQPSSPATSLILSSAGVQTTDQGAFQVIAGHLDGTVLTRNANFASVLSARSSSLLFLDPSTYLPSLLEYSVQSDSGAATIFVEIRYSNYQNQSGLMVPMHIERYLNGSLDLSIDLSQVAQL